MKDYFKRGFVFCFSEVLFSFPIKMSMPEAIKIEIAFLSLGNPKGPTVDYLFCAEYIEIVQGDEVEGSNTAVCAKVLTRGLGTRLKSQCRVSVRTETTLWEKISRREPATLR